MRILISAVGWTAILSLFFVTSTYGNEAQKKINEVNFDPGYEVIELVDESYSRQIVVHHKVKKPKGNVDINEDTEPNLRTTNFRKPSSRKSTGQVDFESSYLEMQKHYSNEFSGEEF